MNFKNVSEISVASGVVVDSNSRNEFTENYIKVKIPWYPYLCNKLVKVKLTEIDDEGFMKAKVKEKIKERESLYSYSNW